MRKKFNNKNRKQIKIILYFYKDFLDKKLNKIN